MAPGVRVPGPATECVAMNLYSAVTDAGTLQSCEFLIQYSLTPVPYRVHDDLQEAYNVAR